MNTTLQIVLDLIVQLCALIPLVITLVNYVTKAVKEKNWTKMVELALKLMAEAENKFSTGAEKEEYVVSLVLAAAKEINYDVDETVLREFIKNTILLSKEVNNKKK